MQTSRRGTDRQLGWRGIPVGWCLEDWVRWQLMEQVVPHLCVDKPGGITGEGDRPHKPVLQFRDIKPQNLQLKKPVGVEVAGETLSLTGEFVDPTGS